MVRQIKSAQGVSPAQCVRAGERNNLPVVEAHAVKHVTETLGRRRGVALVCCGEASTWGDRCNIIVPSPRTPPAEISTK